MFSSCTNYDDDINDLNQKIEVTVPVELKHKYSVEKKTTGTTTTWERKPIKFDVVFIVKNAE